MVPKITTVTPPRDIDVINDPFLQNKTPIADPTLGWLVDILIGVSDTDDCITGRTLKSESTLVHATPTIFGWTIVAPLGHDKPQPVLKVQIKEDSLQQSLEKLWELDQVPESLLMSADDQRASEHFHDTDEVQSDGKVMALKRFHQKERSLKQKGILDQFKSIVNEYIELDHADQIPKAEIDDPRPSVY